MKKLKLLSKSMLCIFCAAVSAFGVRIGYIWVNIPDNVFIAEGENYSPVEHGLVSHLFSAQTPVSKSGELDGDGTVKTEGVSTVSFLGMDVKDVTVTTIPKKYVVPCGNCIGVKIYAGGIVVAEKTPFITEDGRNVSPCAQINIKSGDVINTANGINVDSIYNFCKIVENCGGNPVTIGYRRDGKEYSSQITPAIENVSGKYRAGLTVRDSIAGIGTLTYYCPGDNTFGALGHGIECEGELFPAQSGSMENAKIINVVKGRRGSPGEMHGAFSGREAIGKIISNEECGIFGTSEGAFCDVKNAIPTATSDEVTEGDAYIMCTVEGEQPQKYDIQIEKILPYGSGSKQMIIHITDKQLLDKTGGIVQGMSGSPIIQNGKIVGAVTHVFVNDPTRGYGIFIENMLAEAEKIK